MLFVPPDRRGLRLVEPAGLAVGRDEEDGRMTGRCILEDARHRIEYAVTDGGEIRGVRGRDERVEAPEELARRFCVPRQRRQRRA